MAANSASSSGKVTSIAARHSRRRAARLAVVQALYQKELSDSPVEVVITQFLEERLQDDLGGIVLGDIDRDFFTSLARGVVAQLEDLDNIIAAVLDESWTLSRLERLLRIILEAGVHELSHCPDVPAKVIIDEYVEITHSFFSEAEAGMVNGLLDRLARELREDELQEDKKKHS